MSACGALVDAEWMRGALAAGAGAATFQVLTLGQPQFLVALTPTVGLAVFSIGPTPTKRNAIHE